METEYAGMDHLASDLRNLPCKRSSGTSHIVMHWGSLGGETALSMELPHGELLLNVSGFL